MDRKKLSVNSDTEGPNKDITADERILTEVCGKDEPSARIKDADRFYALLLSGAAIGALVPVSASAQEFGDFPGGDSGGGDTGDTSMDGDVLDFADGGDADNCDGSSADCP